MTWRCPACETIHERNDPPCSSCGHDSLERATPPETIETGPSYVWVCPECDREHVKNSPPCSRCGHPMLERREQTFDDVDTDPETPGYVSIVKPYTPVIVLLVLVVGLAASGIVTPSMLPGHGPPSPPGAPGDGETKSGIDLEAVEEEVHDRLEAEREDRGLASRSYDSHLALLATHLNQNEIRATYGVEPAEEPDTRDFDLSCAGTINVHSATFADEAAIDAYADEGELAAAIVDYLTSQPQNENAALSSHPTEGLDVHVGPDDRVFVYYAAC